MNTTIVVAVTDIFFYTKVRDALRPQGYTLERIRNQDEVAEKMASVQPAALILNMNDLAVDAFKALETIQSNPALRSLPILAFANHEEVDTWRRAKELGVTKVVSRNEFSARTKDLVEELIHPQPAGQS
ncbi:MAG: histidine kinase [Nitrospira sp.]|nr:histidine kinase [Nitrospira sp.]MBX3340911.1 histidine kinase [Nitrospira sp.]MBX3369436.1 histidine kinase [Nitrospira sp.]